MTFYSSASLFLAACSSLSCKLSLLRSTVCSNLSLAKAYLWLTFLHHSFLESSILALRCSALSWRSCCLAWILAGESFRPRFINFLCTSYSTFPIEFGSGASLLDLLGVISRLALLEEVCGVVSTSASASLRLLMMPAAWFYLLVITRYLLRLDCFLPFCPLVYEFIRSNTTTLVVFLVLLAYELLAD